MNIIYFESNKIMKDTFWVKVGLKVASLYVVLELLLVIIYRLFEINIPYVPEIINFPLLFLIFYLPGEICDPCTLSSGPSILSTGNLDIGIYGFLISVGIYFLLGILGALIYKKIKKI